MLPFLFVLTGATIGIASGMMGIGGAILLVPFLTLVFHFQHKTAVGTSLAMLQLPVGILGVLAYYRGDHVEVKTAALLAVGYFGGAWIGSQIALSEVVSQAMLQRIFGLFMIYVAFNMIFKSEQHAWATVVSILASGVAWLLFIATKMVGKQLARPITVQAALQYRLTQPIEREYDI
jgi:uncharacterized protein